MTAPRTVPPSLHDRMQRSTLADEAGADPYRSARHWPEPCACPDCHAVFENGRWRWHEPLPGVPEHRCPACQRVRDDFPGGTVHLQGPFFRAHCEEIMARVRSVSDHAYATHPLQRLMRIEETEDEALITTTDPHLARTIGRAVDHAWKGELDLDVAAEGAPRVTWRR